MEAPQDLPLDRLLLHAARAVARQERRRSAERGLSATAAAVLDVLSGRDGLSHRELAAAAGVTPATLTPVVDGLVADGLVRRARDPVDRRVVRLSVTARGRTSRGAAAAGGLPRPAREREVRAWLCAVAAAAQDVP